MIMHMNFIIKNICYNSIDLGYYRDFLAWKIYNRKLPQKILCNARTFANVAQHLRDFGRFEMNKRDLGRQREDRILVAEEDIPHEIQERHFQRSF
jgi:hypothetical protein